MWSLSKSSKIIILKTLTCCLSTFCLVYACMCKLAKTHVTYSHRLTAHCQQHVMLYKQGIIWYFHRTRLLALKRHKNTARQVTSTVTQPRRQHSRLRKQRNAVTLESLARKLHWNSSQGHQTSHAVKRCTMAERCRQPAHSPQKPVHYSVQCMTWTLCRALFVWRHREFGSEKMAHHSVHRVPYQQQSDSSRDSSPAPAANHRLMTANWSALLRTVLCIHTLAAMNKAHKTHQNMWHNVCIKCIRTH